MRAGLKRERVTIRRRVETPDDQAGRSVTPTIVATVWAQVVAKSSTEGLATEAVRALTAYEVTVAHGVDVLVADEVVWRGKTLQVQGVRDPDGRRVDLVLDCVGP